MRCDAPVNSPVIHLWGYLLTGWSLVQSGPGSHFGTKMRTSGPEVSTPRFPPDFVSSLKSCILGSFDPDFVYSHLYTLHQRLQVMSPETAVVRFDPPMCRFGESRQDVGCDLRATAVACLRPLGARTSGIANTPQFRNAPFEVGVVQLGQSVLNRLLRTRRFEEDSFRCNFPNDSAPSMMLDAR